MNSLHFSTLLLCLPLLACAKGNQAIATGTGGAVGGGTGGATGSTGVGSDGGAFPPSDSWIAFDSNREQGNRDLYLMRPDGSSLQRLTTEPSVDQEPAWSPDGQRLAFSSDRVGATLQIFVMKLADQTVTQITSRPEGADQPAWSADGQLIAFHSGTGVYTSRLDGTGETRWFDGGDAGAGGGYRHPAFSPDGVWIVADFVNGITRARLDGTGSQRDIVPAYADTSEMPSVSPDSDSFAFATYCEIDMESIWIAPLSGLDPAAQWACDIASRVTPAGTFAQRPSSGPYGFLACESGATRSSNMDIAIIPVVGGAPINLTNGLADNRNPAWSGKVGSAGQ
jgi:Tol biopolymer transport system component